MTTTITLDLNSADSELLQQLQKEHSIDCSSELLLKALKAYALTTDNHNRALNECKRLNQQVHLYRSILLDTEIACRALTSKVSAETLHFEQPEFEDVS